MALSHKNLILSRLSNAEFQLLEPHLEPADLPLLKVLERSGRPIKTIYFPDSGFASVVANGSSKHPIEVGLIGREGMTGLPVVLGGDRNDHETYMQAAGSGQCIRASDLRKAIDNSVTLHRSLLRYAHAFLNQATQNRRRQWPLQDRRAAGALAADGGRPSRQRRVAADPRVPCHDARSSPTRRDGGDPRAGTSRALFREAADASSSLTARRWRRCPTERTFRPTTSSNRAHGEPQRWGKRRGQRMGSGEAGLQYRTLRRPSALACQRLAEQGCSPAPSRCKQ